MLTPTLTTIGENKNHIIAEMIRNQLPDIPSDKKLLHTDFKRMVRYLNNSIFTPDTCSLWQGYVTDRKKKNKGSYVNFYFRQKKVALHRLLYLNFLGPLADDEYVKFRCERKGHCCSVHCLEKHKYRRLPAHYSVTSASLTSSSHTTNCIGTVILSTSASALESFDEEALPLPITQIILVPEERLNVFFI
jgi:hypothetical protein